MKKKELKYKLEEAYTSILHWSDEYNQLIRKISERDRTIEKLEREILRIKYNQRSKLEELIARLTRTGTPFYFLYDHSYMKVWNKDFEVSIIYPMSDSDIEDLEEIVKQYEKA